MKTLLVATALASAAASTAHAEPTSTRFVSVSGVNWSDEAQVAHVHRRIARAARAVCDTGSRFRSYDIACERAAMDGGLAQVERIRARVKLATR